MINRLINWWESYLEDGRRKRIEAIEERKRAENACIFCGKYNDGVKNITSHVWVHGVYSSWHPTYKYHRSCLEDVIGNPEKYPNNTGYDSKVDLALKITEEMAYWAARIKQGQDILAEQEKESERTNA